MSWLLFAKALLVNERRGCLTLDRFQRAEESLNDTIAQRSTESHGLRAKLVQSEALVSSLQRDLTQTRAIKPSTEAALHRAQSAEAQLRGELVSSRSNIRSLTAQVSKLNARQVQVTPIATLSDPLTTRLSDDVKQLRKDLEEARALKKLSEEDRDASNSLILRLEQDSEMARTSASKTTAELHAKIAELEGDITALRQDNSQITDSRQRVQMVEKELEASETAKQLADSDLTRSKVQVTSLQHKCDLAEARTTRLLEDGERLRQNLEESLSTIDDMDARYQKVAGDFKTSNDASSSMITELDSEVARLRQLVAETQQNNAEILSRNETGV